MTWNPGQGFWIVCKEEAESVKIVNSPGSRDEISDKALRIAINSQPNRR